MNEIKQLTIKEIHQRFRWIPPWEFLMGSPEDEPERFEDETLHRVILTRGYWIAETACTQELWEAVMGDNPSMFKWKQLPVENVSWNDCQKFIQQANTLLPYLKLRLPTEAEWEYACRAGTTTPFHFGENITPDQVNYDGDCHYNKGKKGLYRGKTVDVTSLPCNSLGLYQMHGNVWEWCEDRYADGYYKHSPAADPPGPETGDYRVLRGGCWGSDVQCVRSACRGRGSGAPDYRGSGCGFRLAGDVRRGLRRTKTMTRKEWRNLKGLHEIKKKCRGADCADCPYFDSTKKICFTPDPGEVPAHWNLPDLPKKPRKKKFEDKYILGDADPGEKISKIIAKAVMSHRSIKCRVWDDNPNEYAILDIISIDLTSTRPYKTQSHKWYKHAELILREEKNEK